MSTLYDIHTIEFNGRKPSRAQVMRAVGKALEQGHKAITVFWGENTLDLDFHPASQQWHGVGWIKQISGDDIARELNEIRQQAIKDLTAARKFYNDHFQFIHIR